MSMILKKIKTVMPLKYTAGAQASYRLFVFFVEFDEEAVSAGCGCGVRVSVKKYKQ